MNVNVKAKLNYLVPGVERPIYIASRGGADAQLNIGAEFEEHQVEITNARQSAVAPRLDREGFELRQQHSEIEDFYALERVKDQYEAELRQLILAATGADDMLVFDHTLRSDSAEVRGARNTREPASVIHNDYTDVSAETRLRDLLSEEEAISRLKQRYAIVNAWRSVAEPIERSPLACCDASSISVADLVASERRAAERVGELELVTWNPQHRWHYYPQMTRDEVLLIKTFDSAINGTARRSIHSAFDDPNTRTDAPPRQSIESRMIVFY